MYIHSQLTKNKQETKEANEKLAAGLQNCPYCSGTSGLLQRSTIKLTTHMNWKCETVDELKQEYPKPANCIDCGKPFKIYTQ